MLKTLGISGKNPDGKAYKGTLTGIQSGAGYTFDWDAGTAVSGFGVRADQSLLSDLAVSNAHLSVMM